MIAEAPSTDCTTNKSGRRSTWTPVTRTLLVVVPLLVGIICTGCRTETGGTGILTRYDDPDDASSPKLNAETRKRVEASLEGNRP